MRSIPAIGELTQDGSIPEWWESRPVPVPFFSGAPLRFVVDHEPDDPSAPYPPDVEDAVVNFLALDEADRTAASGEVFENYREVVESVDGDFEGVPVGGPTEVWGLVRPQEVFVSRRDEGERNVYYVQVLCECAWEEEHGLQLIFRSGHKLVRVSSQDGHLTDADAYGLPEDGWT